MQEEMNRQQKEMNRQQEEMNKQIELIKEKMKKKAKEKRFSLELLQARQGLEEVSLECQVIEKEVECGGYLPPEKKNV